MAKIFINPGHAPNGNPDPGACGEFLRESDVAAFVGDVVAKDLQAVGYETKVFQSDELGEICRVANAWGADYFISIHLNSAENRSAKGTETFYYVGSPNSEKLASAIQHQLVKTMGTIDRGLKNGNWLYVLKHTEMPAILVELGFISNKAEEIYMNDHKQVMAHAIARGVTDAGI